MQVDTNVSESDMGGVRQGQTVDFTVDAYTNRVFKGIVDAGAKSPDHGTKRGHLRCRGKRPESRNAVDAGNDRQHHDSN